MMNKTTDNNSDKPSQSTELSILYKLEFDAVCECLNADPKDLAHLLDYIHANQVPRRRISGMLKNAFSNLVQLRESQSDLFDLKGMKPEYYELLEQLKHALKAGENFSLDGVRKVLAAICTDCIEHSCKAEAIAQILGAQALAFMISQKFEQAAELYEKAASAPGLDLSSRWEYQNKRALALVDLGRDYADNAALELAVELFETTILPLSPQGEQQGQWAQTQSNLGDALGILGHRHRGSHILEQSIATYEQALSQIDRMTMPQEWATAQNNLGNALGALGQRKGEKELLEKSVAAFGLALEERTQKNTPDEWATSQNNLGAALHSLGQHGEGTRLLSKSVAAYTKVLKVWTRQRMPLEWSAALNNLGTVLRVLGERQSGQRSLEKSVAAYKNALAVRSRELFPQDWAMTQNNLGASLQKLAERVDGTQELEDSVAAYGNALKEWTREKMPMGWTMTMANLGVARRTLAERTRDITIARMAVDDIVTVTEIFRDASHAQYRELSEEQLTIARELVEELGN
jgi:tetratricopeptide (TPR) repeat protein